MVGRRGGTEGRVRQPAAQEATNLPATSSVWPGPPHSGAAPRLQHDLQSRSRPPVLTACLDPLLFQHPPTRICKGGVRVGGLCRLLAAAATARTAQLGCRCCLLPPLLFLLLAALCAGGRRRRGDGEGGSRRGRPWGAAQRRSAGGRSRSVCLRRCCCGRRAAAVAFAGGAGLIQVYHVIYHPHQAAVGSRQPSRHGLGLRFRRLLALLLLGSAAGAAACWVGRSRPARCRRHCRCFKRSQAAL